MHSFHRFLYHLFTYSLNDSLNIFQSVVSEYDFNLKSKQKTKQYLDDNNNNKICLK